MEMDRRAHNKSFERYNTQERPGCLFIHPLPAGADYDFRRVHAYYLADNHGGRYSRHSRLRRQGWSQSSLVGEVSS